MVGLGRRATVPTSSIKYAEPIAMAVAVTDVPRAVAAATSTASALGLTVDRAVVLHASNRLALRLLPSDVVARVALAAHGAAQLEVDIASRLAGTGSSGADRRALTCAATRDIAYLVRHSPEDWSARSEVRDGRRRAGGTRGHPPVFAQSGREGDPRVPGSIRGTNRAGFGGRSCPYDRRGNVRGAAKGRIRSDARLTVV